MKSMSSVAINLTRNLMTGFRPKKKRWRTTRNDHRRRYTLRRILPELANPAVARGSVAELAIASPHFRRGQRTRLDTLTAEPTFQTLKTVAG
jgi:hypothetical protein